MYKHGEGVNVLKRLMKRGKRATALNSRYSKRSGILKGLSDSTPLTPSSVHPPDLLTHHGDTPMGYR